MKNNLEFNSVLSGKKVSFKMNNKCLVVEVTKSGFFRDSSILAGLTQNETKQLVKFIEKQNGSSKTK